MLLSLAIFWMTSIDQSAHAQRPGLGGLRGGAGAGQQRQQSDTSSLRSGRKKGSLFLDDSTKNVYGPNTTLWTTRNDLFLNRARYRPIDTGIINYHRWTYPKKSNQLLQDLGNTGTALYPILPSVRRFAGKVSGFEAYEPYFISEEPEFFDTKSPYTKIQIIWGGNGRSSTRIEFKRNINPRWNFGFNYRPILVDKQLDKRRKGDRHVTSQYYDFHSSYRSKNDRYEALGFYRRIKHRVFENGGVNLTSDAPFENYFATNAAPVLYKAESNELRRELFYQHRYRLASALEVYQSISWNKQQNNFIDAYSAANNLKPYDNWIRVKSDTTAADDQMNFGVLEQEAGFKGRKNFLFYNAFYKFRNYRTTYRYLDVDTLGAGFKGIEHFIGGRLSLSLDSLSELTGKFEISQLGNYSLEARLTSRWLDGHFVQSLAAPGSFYQAYRGVHDEWQNEFKSTSGLEGLAYGKVSAGRFRFSPGMGYTLFSKQVFMKFGEYGVPQTVLPFQSDGTQSLITPRAKIQIPIGKKLQLEAEGIRNLIGGNSDGYLQLPDWMVNGQASYKGLLFKGNLETHIGFDINWRPAWNAPGYDPVTQHYYNQQKEKVDQWWGADFFINGRIKRGRFFFTVHNLLQAGGRPGYLIIPGYPGQRTVIDLGFELVLFD